MADETSNRDPKSGELSATRASDADQHTGSKTDNSAPPPITNTATGQTVKNVQNAKGDTIAGGAAGGMVNEPVTSSIVPSEAQPITTSEGSTVFGNPSVADATLSEQNGYTQTAPLQPSLIVHPGDAPVNIPIIASTDAPLLTRDQQIKTLHTRGKGSSYGDIEAILAMLPKDSRITWENGTWTVREGRNPNTQGAGKTLHRALRMVGAHTGPHPDGSGREVMLDRNNEPVQSEDEERVADQQKNQTTGQRTDTAARQDPALTTNRTDRVQSH